MWDAFHIRSNSKLKSNYSLKKKYTINNLSLPIYKKRFLYAAVGVPGSTHDTRMLKGFSFLIDVLAGRVFPDFKYDIQLMRYPTDHYWS